MLAFSCEGQAPCSPLSAFRKNRASSRQTLHSLLCTAVAKVLVETPQMSRWIAVILICWQVDPVVFLRQWEALRTGKALDFGQCCFGRVVAPPQPKVALVNRLVEWRCLPKTFCIVRKAPQQRASEPEPVEHL